MNAFLFEDFHCLKALGFPLFFLLIHGKLTKKIVRLWMRLKGSKENQSFEENSLSTATLATSLVKFPSNKWFKHKKVPIQQKKRDLFYGNSNTLVVYDDVSWMNFFIAIWSKKKSCLRKLKRFRRKGRTFLCKIN